jgi:hypothetical protein
MGVKRDSGMAVQHGEQQCEPVRLEADRDPARVREQAGVHQSLHLDQHLPRTLAGHRHHRPRHGFLAARKEDRGWIAHFAQAAFLHREHAYFVGRAEAVLDRADHPEPAPRIALEVQHRVHHVLEHAGAGDHALARHVTDQEYGSAARFCVANQARRRLAQLRDRSGCRLDGGHGHGLDRVDHEDRCACIPGQLDDAFDRRFRDQLEPTRREFQPVRPLGNLPHGFLAGRVQDALSCRKRCGALQQQRRLANARLAPDQRHGPRNESAAKHAVEFREPGGPACLGSHRELTHSLRPAAAGRRDCGAHARFRERRHGVPLSAGRALPAPPGRIGAAG